MAGLVCSALLAKTSAGVAASVTHCDGKRLSKPTIIAVRIRAGVVRVQITRRAIRIVSVASKTDGCCGVPFLGLLPQPREADVRGASFSEHLSRHRGFFLEIADPASGVTFVAKAWRREGARAIASPSLARAAPLLRLHRLTQQHLSKPTSSAVRIRAGVGRVQRTRRAIRKGSVASKTDG